MKKIFIVTAVLVFAVSAHAGIYRAAKAATKGTYHYVVKPSAKASVKAVKVTAKTAKTIAY
jgi:hypothetical protein